MSELLINNLLNGLIGLLLIALWVWSIVYVDRHIRDQAGMPLPARFLWRGVSVLPIIGVLAYFLTHSERVPSPQGQTPVQGQRTREHRRPSGNVTLLRPPRLATLPGGQPPPVRSEPRLPTMPATPQERFTQRSTRPSAPITMAVEIVKGRGQLKDDVQLARGTTILGARPHPAADKHLTLIDDPAISREHLQITVQGNKVTLKNLTQRAATWVDDRPISPQKTVQLAPTAIVRIGDTHLRFVKADHLPQAAAPREVTNLSVLVRTPAYHIFAVEDGPHKDERFVVTELPAQIGRTKQCAICLDRDTAVSREHAELFTDDGTLRIRNLQTSNRTTVNGRSVTNKSLNPDSVIRVGRSQLRLIGS